MKTKYLNIALAIIIILSIIINFSDFLMGSPSRLSNITITIIYIISFFTFIWLSKENKYSLVFSVIWSLLTLICAVLILAVNLNEELILSFIIPFAMIFITPFYGMETFYNNQQKFLIVSIIIIIISLAWIVSSIKFLKSSKSRK